MTHTRYTTQEQIEAMREEIRREKGKILGRVSKNDFSPSRRLPHLPKGKTVFNAAGWAAFLAVCLTLIGSIISVQMTKSRGEVPNIWGFQLFTIESGSMEPTLKVGTVIISHKPKDPQALQVKDIVTFRTLSNAIVTHRIIEVMTGSNDSKVYRTKGDNPQNTADQELLTPNRVIGIFVAKVPLT